MSKLIESEWIENRLRSYLENEEDIPDPSIGQILKIVNDAPMAFDIDNLIKEMNERIKDLEERKDYAEDHDELFAARGVGIALDEASKTKEMIMSNVKMSIYS